jgi:multimeric flavodoxin WrbA
MKAVILDGSQADDNTGRRIYEALASQLLARGWQVEHFILREKKIGNCAGDFFCWIRTPGMCNVKDDNLAVAEALATSDMMVYMSPITFGGYSSTLKRMIDHQIQNVSPFFAKVNGETHHKKRYQKNPDLLALGWLEQADAQSERIFRHLVQRNALNWHAERYVGDVVLASQSDEELQAAAQGWLSALQSGQNSPSVTLSAATVAVNCEVDVRRALLLVGSPKTRKSTSNSLGGYMFEHLQQQGVQTETVYLHTVLRSPARWQALIEALDTADLVTLAFPLYVDTLPAPVTEALERIAIHRQGRQTRPQLFTAIANCGFPEAYQTATALAICQTFAEQAGFVWAGSLALGAGEAVNGKPLAEAGGMAIRIRQSLELATEALAQGQAIPLAARDMMAKPIIPHWAYRLTGKLRWNSWAKRHNAKKLLKRQPYLAQVR